MLVWLMAVLAVRRAGAELTRGAKSLESGKKEHKYRENLQLAARSRQAPLYIAYVMHGVDIYYIHYNVSCTNTRGSTLAFEFTLARSRANLTHTYIIIVSYCSANNRHELSASRLFSFGLFYFLFSLSFWLLLGVKKVVTPDTDVVRHRRVFDTNRLNSSLYSMTRSFRLRW